MPRGGRRAGAGRKPKPAHLRLIDGGADRRGGLPESAVTAAVTTAADQAAIAPPATLSPSELAVWREWAPLAVDAGTLVAATVPAFLHLVEIETDRRELRARFKRAPLLVTAEGELSLRREHRALMHELGARLKDFCISPFGKEIVPDAEQGEADPLDAFTRRGPNA